MADKKNNGFFDDVSQDEEEFVDSIPVPEDEEIEHKHKLVHAVKSSAEEDDDMTEEKEEKKGFVSDFFSGVAAGAKTLGENIKAGAESVASSAHSKNDEASFYDDDDDSDDFDDSDDLEDSPEEDDSYEDSEGESKSGIKDFLDSLSPKKIIIGAAAITAAIIAIILLSVSSCSKDNENKDNPDNESGTDIIIDGNVTGSDIEEDVPLEIPSRAEKYEEALKLNKDVVGWIYIPGLSDVDAGICQDKKSYSYNKRDITGKSVSATYWIKGAYYSHLRNTFGDSLDSLSKNTVVFGHSDLGLTNLAYTDDDPTGPLFSQLFNFKNPSFAAETPYIYLTTAAGDSVWEVFSVFYNDANIDGGKALWYIEPEPGNAFTSVVDTMRDRSLYDYDVEVNSEDKILTLSTCTVGYGLSSRSRYRFVISAKLVENTEGLMVKKASFTINEDAPVPESFRDQFNGYVSTWNKETTEN